MVDGGCGNLHWDPRSALPSPPGPLTWNGKRKQGPAEDRTRYSRFGAWWRPTRRTLAGKRLDPPSKPIQVKVGKAPHPPSCPPLPPCRPNWKLARSEKHTSTSTHKHTQAHTSAHKHKHQLQFKLKLQMPREFEHKMSVSSRFSSLLVSSRLFPFRRKPPGLAPPSMERLVRKEGKRCPGHSKETKKTKNMLHTYHQRHPLKHCTVDFDRKVYLLYLRRQK